MENITIPLLVHNEVEERVPGRIIWEQIEQDGYFDLATVTKGKLTVTTAVKALERAGYIWRNLRGLYEQNPSVTIGTSESIQDAVKFLQNIVAPKEYQMLKSIHRETYTTIPRLVNDGIYKDRKQMRLEAILLSYLGLVNMKLVGPRSLSISLSPLGKALVESA